MVRFMYQRSTFVVCIRYSHLFLPFVSLRRFFITSQNLNVVPSWDLISYLDIAFLLPLRNSKTDFLIPSVLLTAIRNLSPCPSRKRITSTLLNSRSMRIIDFFNSGFFDSENNLRTNSIFEMSSDAYYRYRKQLLFGNYLHCGVRLKLGCSILGLATDYKVVIVSVCACKWDQMFAYGLYGTCLLLKTVHGVIPCWQGYLCTL